MAGRERSELNTWWKIGLLVVGLAFRAAFRLRYAGTRHIPRTGPAILAANHVSALDGVVLGLAPGERAKRMTRFLSAVEFFRNPWYGWALRLYEQIPIERGASDHRAMNEALDTIRGGAMTGIFPEGRVSVDGELQRGRSGTSRLALATGAPVVPVGIWGTQVRWPKEGLTLRRPLRPALVLAFGEPIPAQGDLSNRADVRAYTKLVMDAIAEQREIAKRYAEAMG
jgi:1-acyl-sn-glycerol-3-phosphate acyltransferase